MTYPFRFRKFAPRTYVIQGAGADAYLLEGDREAIMIDAGCSTENIRAFAQSITELPVRRVINTHSHFDHTGGNGYFDVIYGTEGIARSGKNVMGGDPASFPLDYTYTLVRDGEVLPFEGRPLEILVLDSHSPESIAILDRTQRLLFPGDEIESEQVLLLPGYAEEPGQIHAKPPATVETFLRAMDKINGYRDAFDAICPAHNGTPIDPSYVDWFISLAQGILEGSIIGSTDCAGPGYDASAAHFPLPDAHYRRASYKGATLVYCDRMVVDADYAYAGDLPPATRLHIQSAATARR